MEKRGEAVADKKLKVTEKIEKKTINTYYFEMRFFEGKEKNNFGDYADIKCEEIVEDSIYKFHYGSAIPFKGWTSPKVLEAKSLSDAVDKYIDFIKNLEIKII